MIQNKTRITNKEEEQQQQQKQQQYQSITEIKP
jgi:hypothetical protein